MQITSDVYWRYPIFSELMGVTKKAKVTFTCEPDLKDGLENWAHSESRTLSNLIEMVIRQAYETRQKSLNLSDPVVDSPTEAETKYPPATKAKRGNQKKTNTL
jgi:hypothetical protein